jgi:hypothetical protein
MWKERKNSKNEYKTKVKKSKDLENTKPGQCEKKEQRAV